MQRLLARIDRPAISPLVEVELYCVVARKVRSGELETPAGRRIFAEFQRHLEKPRFDVVPVGTGEYAFARRCFEDLSSPLRTVDALHLAAASANELTLITADRDLARAAKRFGVKYKLIP